jgi:hypothetical protein
VRRESWLTGNGPGAAGNCLPSSRWRSVEGVSENYLPVVVATETSKRLSIIDSFPRGPHSAASPGEGRRVPSLVGPIPSVRTFSQTSN